MKIFEKLFAGRSSRNRALISYGRGPEGEEVMIDITESRRINVTVIIAFLIILPLVMLLFSAIYGAESLKVTSANYFPKGWCIILVGLLCASQHRQCPGQDAQNQTSLVREPFP